MAIGTLLKFSSKLIEEVHLCGYRQIIVWLSCPGLFFHFFVNKTFGDTIAGCPLNSSSVLRCEVEDDERKDEKEVNSKHTSPESTGAETVTASYEKLPSLPKETKSSAVMTPAHSSAARIDECKF